MYRKGKVNKKSSTECILSSLRKVSPLAGPIPFTYSIGVFSMFCCMDKSYFIFEILMAKVKKISDGVINISFTSNNKRQPTFGQLPLDY